MLDFIAIGGATRDIFFSYDDLKKRRDKESISGQYLMIPYGEKIVSQNTYYAYGGGAVNSSIGIARLGGRVAAICSIGKEGTGSLIHQKLKNEGVVTSMVQRDTKRHTGLSIFILGKDNEHSGFLERGANDHLRIKKISYLKRSRWLYITSLTGDSEKLLPEVFDYAKRNGLKIAFNPGSRQIKSDFSELGEYIQKTDILLLNMDEAEAVLRLKSKNNHRNKRSLLAEIESLGATISVVTDAENGSHAVFQGNVYSQPALKTEVIDTTGAGDSFGSTFSFFISKGHSIPSALRLAAINSASVVSKMGAQDGLMSYNQIKRSKWC